MRVRPGRRGRRRRRVLLPVRGEVGEVALGEVDPLLVGLDEEVAAARDAGVHLRAAHLLERDVLADDHLGHPRRAEVHRGVAVAHDHDVAEGGDVGAAGGARPEQHADLRHGARELHLVEEDPARVAAAGEHLDLLGDPRARRVDEVDHRHAVRERGLLDAEDLLDRLRPPGAGLDRRVVGHQRDRAPADRPHAGDDAVGAEPLGLPVGQQRVLGERAGVEQPRDPLAHGQLALLGRLGPVALGPARVRAVERLLYVAHARHASARRRCARPVAARRSSRRARAGAGGAGAGRRPSRRRRARAGSAATTAASPPRRR